MNLHITLPEALELYREISGNQGFLVRTWMEVAEGTTFEMGDVGIFKLNGQELLAFKAIYQAQDFYVLAKDIDSDVRVLCEQWQHRRQRRNPLAEDTAEVIGERIRRYARTILSVV